MKIILDYVQDSLPEDQQDDFESHYLGCDQCAEELIFTEKAAVTMKRFGASIFAQAHRQKRGSLAALGEAVVEKLRTLSWTDSMRHHAPAIASVLLFVVLGGSYVWLMTTRFQRTEIDAGTFPSLLLESSSPYLTHYPWKEVAGEMESAGQEFAAARSQYEHKDYRAAALALEPLTEKYPDQKAALLYLGISLLHQHEFEGAERYLKAFLENDHHHPAGNWFLAQAYLSQHRPTKALPLLSELAENDSLYGGHADRLRKKLESTSR